MSDKPLTVHELRERIHKGDMKDPLVFLESIMSGLDPRKTSRIYKLIMEIDEFSDGAPSKSDWGELTTYVMAFGKFEHVSIGQSINASKTIAEYMHAKRKQLEISDSSSTLSNSFSPLTEEEIILFKATFNDEF